MKPAPRDDGPPVSITIRRTPDGWHHTTVTKHGRSFGGRLLDVSAEDDADTASWAATGLIAGYDACFFHLGLHVNWTPGQQPDQLDGTVYRVNGEPL